MAGELHPTKTRIQLLRDIANGQVLTDITAEPEDGDVIWLFPDAPTTWQNRTRVTARVQELERAGWVEQQPNGMDWDLTDAGRKVLAERSSGG